MANAPGDTLTEVVALLDNTNTPLTGATFTTRLKSGQSTGIENRPARCADCGVNCSTCTVTGGNDAARAAAATSRARNGTSAPTPSRALCRTLRTTPLPSGHRPQHRSDPGGKRTRERPPYPPTVQAVSRGGEQSEPGPPRSKGCAAPPESRCRCPARPQPARSFDLEPSLGEPRPLRPQVNHQAARAVRSDLRVPVLAETARSDRGADRFVRSTS